MRTQNLIRTFRLVLVSIFILAFTAFPNAGNRASNVLQSIAYQDDFEDGQAEAWTLETGWQVIKVDGNSVLAGQGHVWARLNQSFYGDQRLSFRLKLLQGRIHLMICLSGVSRYFIGFEVAGSDLNKQFFPDEFHEGLARGNDLHALDRWYDVEILLEGSQISFFVDGKQEWSYSDPQALPGGSVAFETLESSQAYVDDITIWNAAGAVATGIAPSSASLSWIRLGGPSGGLGYDVRMRPDDPDTMFVTDAWAGLFISTDAGATWSPSNAGITTRTGPTGDAIPVFSVTIDPNDPDIVWAGTQFQRGIFFSSDGGSTWEKRDSGIQEKDGISFRGFTIQPGNSDVVYAAAEISSWVWAGQTRTGREFDLTRGVVYKTTDRGRSWQAVWRGDNLARYVWINPQNTDIVYISTGIFDREAANSDPAAGLPGGEGVLKSTDGGVTWTHVNNGLGNLYVGSLFMHPSNPDILLAGTGNNIYPQQAGAYLTTDGGASWTQTLRSAPYNIESVEFSTSDPSIAYAGNDLAVYRSQDGGRTWSKVTGSGYWGPPGVCAGFPIDFQVDPRNPDRIFANAYGGGNFLSSDGGRTWADASQGYTGALVRSLAVDGVQPGRIYAAGVSGIFVSNAGGYSWEGLSFPPLDANAWTVVAVDPRSPQHLLASTNWTGLAESHDAGHSWKLVLPNPDEHTGFQVIAFNPFDPGIVYLGSAGYYTAGAFNPLVPGKGIFISRDGGATWTSANNALSQDASVYGLAVDPQDPQVVYAATANHGLLKTTDGGLDWQPVQAGLPHSGARQVSFNPVDSGIILAGFERQGIYRSEDGGQSWIPSASGLNPEAQITSIVFGPNGFGNIVYTADLFGGVYRSSDGGQTWLMINNGLTTRAINALAISTDGLHLYAASEGGGAFRLDLNGQPPAAVLEPTAAPAAAPTSAPLSPASPVVPPRATQPSSLPSSSGGFPLWIILGTVGVVIVAVVLFLVLRTSRK